jgi:hypothetical protein
MREGGPALSQRVASSYETATTQARSPSYRCFRGVDKPAPSVQDRPDRVGQLERGDAAGDLGCDRLAV